MAITGGNHEIRARSAVTPAQPSLRVTVSAETSASPAQVLAAARDFSGRREQIWPNVEAKRLEVHDCEDSWAEVTEGTTVLGVFWERCPGWLLRGALAAIEKRSADDEPGAYPRISSR